MIKFLLKLIVAILIANAAWRVGSTYFSHYRFENAVLMEVQDRGRRSDSEIRTRVLDLASQYDVPIDEKSVNVQRNGARTRVDGSYTQSVDVFPGYRYPIPFTIHIDVSTSTTPQ